MIQIRTEAVRFRSTPADDGAPIDVLLLLLLMYAYTACGVIESRLICVIEGEQMENVLLDRATQR